MNATTNDNDNDRATTHGETERERAPLLGSQHRRTADLDAQDSNNTRLEEDGDFKTKTKNTNENENVKEQVGPLDISRRTRYGILAGVFTGTFLSVSFPLTGIATDLC